MDDRLVGIMNANHGTGLHVDNIAIAEFNILYFLRPQFKSDFQRIAPKGVPENAVRHFYVFYDLFRGILKIRLNSDTIVFRSDETAVVTNVRSAIHDAPSPNLNIPGMDGSDGSPNDSPTLDVNHLVACYIEQINVVNLSTV